MNFSTSFFLLCGQSVIDHLDESMHGVTHPGNETLGIYYFAGLVSGSRGLLLISVPCLCIKKCELVFSWDEKICFYEDDLGMVMVYFSSAASRDLRVPYFV